MLGFTKNNDKTEEAPEVGADEKNNGDKKIKATKKLKPKIGLALGSGVARGWAHIGILRRLEEEGIQIDVIAGTSIGAVVGGAYACGNLDRIEAWARDLQDTNFLRFLDFRISGGGLFGSNKLGQIMVDNFGDRNIEDLGIPFTAIACELKSGQEIWLKQGPMCDAIKASFALPGVFEPIRHEHKWLVDGALVNPVPVSVCRAAGCDMVIAVNLSEDIYGRARAKRQGILETGEYGVFNEIASAPTALGRIGKRSFIKRLFGHQEDAPSLFANMVASLNILQNRLSRSRLAGDPPDVTILPRCGHVGLMEFHRADELIKEGVLAFDEALPHLKDALAIIHHRMNS